VAVLTVTALQPSLTWLEPESNLRVIREMADRVAASGSVDVIVLPEAFDGVPAEMDASRGADHVREFVVELARRTEAHVVGGSVAYRHSDGRVFNSCFVVDRTGRLIGEYAKRKLFASERATRTPGEAPGLFDLEGLRIGVLICSDLWYPELAREMYGRVDLVCVPAKTTVPSREFVRYARVLWWSLALTRAVENVVPVVVSDWCEQSHPTCRTAGATSVNDPAGRPDVERTQRRIEEGHEGVVVAQIDLDAVEQVRAYRRSAGLLPRPDANR